MSKQSEGEERSPPLTPTDSQLGQNCTRKSHLHKCRKNSVFSSPPPRGEPARSPVRTPSARACGRTPGQVGTDASLGGVLAAPQAGPDLYPERVQGVCRATDRPKDSATQTMGRGGEGGASRERRRKRLTGGGAERWGGCRTVVPTQRGQEEEGTAHRAPAGDNRPLRAGCSGTV